MKFSSSFLILLLFMCNSFAQGSENSLFANQKQGVEAVLELKEGTLIVRLYSFKEKIAHLESTEGKARADFEQERIDYANQTIMQEFSQDYDFSNVVFTYGKELDQYLQNTKEDIFLNKDLEFDSEIQIKDGSIFILASRSTSNFKLCDTKHTPIENPSIEYISHHLDSKFQGGLDAMTQGFREIATSKKSALKMNKRLYSIAKANTK